MKKFIIVTVAIIIVVAVVVCIILQGHNTKNETTENNLQQLGVIDTNTSKSTITKDMAYQGVYNYTHSAYDWSIAQDNPSIMYIEMGEETETEYQVIFRSYTGAVVYFYVDKLNGNTRLIEYVSTLNVKNEVGTINIFDYLK